MSKRYAKDFAPETMVIENCKYMQVVREKQELEKKLESLLAEPEAEPVAWQYKDSAGNIGYSNMDGSGQDGRIPLHTHPPRQPVQLSDDEIIEILLDHCNTVKFARAVIAAYEEKQK